MLKRCLCQAFALSVAVFSAGLLVARSAPLAAQTLTAGGLTATIVDERSAPMRDVVVTIERGGAAVGTLTTDRRGMVTMPILAPGRYAVLAEQLGYQPVRMRDVAVISGGATRVTIHLARRPPPIVTVDEVASDATVTTSLAGRAVTGDDLLAFDRQHDITNTLGGLAQADVPLDGRDGLVESGNGLAPRYSGLTVDGVREALMLHPGLRGDPAQSPLFARDAVDQATFGEFIPDAEWSAVSGAQLGAETARGGSHFAVSPWLTVSSAKLGGRSADNPGDSTATSLRAGLHMGGPIKGDTGAWFVQADFQHVQLPTADPFRAGIAGSDSGDIGTALSSAAQTLHQSIGQWIAPTVRTWSGGSGLGRLDWRFGNNTLLAVRAGGASWTEDNPDVGTDLVNGAGSHLAAHDVSGAIALTTGGAQVSSDTRIGVHTSSRDWTGASLPYTGIVGDGLAIGGAATLPGDFSETGLGAYETIAARFGAHTLKVGGSVEQRTLNYSWLPGSAGEYEFGDVASFAANQGAFYQATRTAPAPDLSITDLSLFLQDNWHASAQLEVFGGIRYAREHLPTDVVTLDAPWQAESGLRNDLVPADSKGSGFGPLGGFTWDASGNGRTTVRGDAGIVPGRFDALALAEVAQFDGNVTVRRATGDLTWPELGASAGTNAGQSITLFNQGINKPRTYKSDISISQRIDDATTLTVTGAYYHTDYLLRRSDLNRVPGSVETGSDGRPIYGTLQQYGGLITPAVGSNRRFSDFDMVYGLTSDGYTDDYDAGLTLEHRVARGLDALLTYTYSRTTDNLPGQLSADPADQLSPFPGGLNGVAWEQGRSDLDIPNRMAFTLSYATPSKSPLTIAARYRYQSGLPFTPGFRPGVDANGDGSGGNDPAFVGTTIPGMSTLSNANGCLASQANQIASRNSCRDPGMQSLDLMLALPLPLGTAHPVLLTVDAFNVAGNTTGIYDHAAVLVDPKGAITFDGAGHVVLPLIANPDFGQLLSQRGIPRQVRIGFRVEN